MGPGLRRDGENDRVFDAMLYDARMASLVFASASRALASLRTPGLGKVLAYSVAMALALLVALIALMGGTAGYFATHYTESWLAGTLTIGGVIGSGVVGWLLFPALLPVIVSVFDERIISLIETKEYPAGAHGKEAPFWPVLWHDLRFALLAVVLNLLLLPLFFIPLIGQITYYWLNGYLLGRAFFALVAQRHMPRKAAEELRKRQGGQVLLAGMLLALVASLPFGNLIAAFFGLALMVHLYQGLGSDRGG